MTETFDHLEIGGRDDAAEILAGYRSECPVQHSTAHGGFWTMLSHELVAEVARDPETFSSASGVIIPGHAYPAALPPIESDPPEHMQVRHPLLPTFAPGAVAEYEDDLRAIVTQLIDAFIDDDTADLAKQLTEPFPGMSLGLMMAVDQDEILALRELTVHLMQNPDDAETVGQVMGFFVRLYEDRVANPGDDLPTAVLSLQIDGETIQAETYLMIMATVMNAGLDTTANAGGNMLRILGQDADVRAALQADRSKIPSFIEEVLRWVAPIPASARKCLAKTEIGGQTIEEGEWVQLNWLAANHDPAEFENPEVFDMERFPNRHFAFGQGPHRCLGIHLARLQLKVLAEEVLDRLPNYEVHDDDVVTYIGVTRGISSLPVTLRP